ncbi:MAG TPA: ATP-binding cassette domain-containing protein [Actinomycetes bacterium]
MSTPDDGEAAVETRGLGKRFGSTWALRDCDVCVPRGRVAALVGPNGAGKTTLLRLLVGLSTPTQGEVRALGGLPEQSSQFLASVGHLDQRTPLYGRLSVADHLRLGAHLNPRWDAEDVRAQLSHLKIPFDRAVGQLSGGQRAQVALRLALAKRPRLLLLDEPVAALDPLARREFLTSLTEAVADADVTVLMSSHLLAELERVCDYLVLLSAGRTQLVGDIDQLLTERRVLVGPREGSASVIRRFPVVKTTHTARQSRRLVRSGAPVLGLGMGGRRDRPRGDRAGLHGPRRRDRRRQLGGAAARCVMSYLIWRQHRNQVDFAGLTFLVLAVLLGATGLVMSGDYHHALATCAATASCATLSETLFQGDGLIINVVNLSIVAPALLGRFWGAPLVAKETDDGTHVLVWTQSVTRRRWMGTNLAEALLAAAVWGALLSALVSWWRIPENALFGRFAGFDVQGIVPVAYSVFAVALGIAVGAWLRRPLPALATTLGVLVAVRAVVGLFLRPHLLAPLRAMEPLVNNVSGARPARGCSPRTWPTRPDTPSTPPPAASRRRPAPATISPPACPGSATAAWSPTSRTAATGPSRPSRPGSSSLLPLSSRSSPPGSWSPATRRTATDAGGRRGAGRPVRRPPGAAPRPP